MSEIIPHHSDLDQSSNFWQRARLPLQFVAILWFIHFIAFFMQRDIGIWGVYPRTIGGAWGILFAPLIHANFMHLVSNTFPLLISGIILFYFYPRIAVRSFMQIYILTGIAVWLMARGGTYHIGVSGVVYGLVSFLFWTGVFRRNMRAMALAAAMMVLFSGMFAGILPNQEGISWESHLFGGLVGIFSAYYFKNDLELEETLHHEVIKTPDAPIAPYFPNDIFERTKLERYQDFLRQQQEQQEQQQG